MTRFDIAPNTELLLAERSLAVPALVVGLAAGLNAFFWLRARYGVGSFFGRAALFAGALCGGVVAVGGLIVVAGLAAPLLGWMVAGVALAGVVVASYVLGTKGASFGGSAALLLLRLAAIAMLVVLYFEPTLKFVERDVRRSKLLVLVDVSGSMKIADGPRGLSRLAWVKEEILGRRGALAKLEEDFELELYSFSDRLTPETSRFATVEPVGTSTAFAPTVGEACRKCDKLATMGALVFTDGIDNSGHDPVREIAAAGLPVFPVAVGSKLRERGDFKDIAVARVDYERFLAANNKTTVTAHIDAVGLNGRRVAVRLLFDGKEKDSQPLVLDDFAGTQPVELSFTPAEKGAFKCSVEVTTDPEERLTDNNQKEFDVLVTEPTIKVLLVEGVIRSEYKFLLRTLQMDPNVALLALLRTRADTFTQQGTVKDIQLSGFPKDLETLQKFNVLLLGDVDRSIFSASQLRDIQRFVEEGGGLLMAGGYSSLGPGGYDGTPVAETLPVHLGGKDIGQEKDPFEMKLTADGASHPIFSGIEAFFATPEGPAKQILPPLLGCTRVGPARPGAATLAVHPRRTGPTGEPLIVAAVQQYGRGRTMVFAADTTWRWYFALRGLGRDTPYIRFWGQAIRWLAGQKPKEEDEKGLVAYTDRRFYEPGATVRIYARVRDEHGQAVNQANVTATITGPAGPTTTRQIPYLPDSTGKYEVDFSPPAPGEYEIDVAAESFGKPLDEVKKISFRVGRPNLEFDKLDLDDEMLKRLAEETKGKFVTLVGLPSFIEQLKSTERARSTITSVDVWSDRSITVFGQSVSLYLVVAFGVFSALLTAEWVLRRRRQLL